MSTTPALHVLKTLVDPATKLRFRALAAARQLSESELLRAVVRQASTHDTPGEVAAEAYGAQTGEATAPPDRIALERMTLRLPGFVLDAARARAQSKGMAPSRYVAALVQSHVRQQPVLTAAEIQALQASNRELAALGRNLNQIAHALNSAAHETERVKLAQLERLQAAIADNRDAIRALVRASQNAWEAA